MTHPAQLPTGINGIWQLVHADDQINIYDVADAFHISFGPANLLTPTTDSQPDGPSC